MNKYEEIYGKSWDLSNENPLIENENYIGSSSNESSERELSFTTLRRNNILSKPIENLLATVHMQRAKYKLRGVLTMKNHLRDLYTFGVGAQLVGIKNQYKKNIAAILHEKMRVLRKQSSINDTHRCCLFYPESKLIQTWSLVMIFILFYTFIFTPWIIAFENVQIGDTLFIIELVVDSCFFCDIIITLNTAYYNKERLETKRRWIFTNYLKGFLLIDLFSIFPFYLAESSDHFEENSPVRILRLYKISRIFRASKVFKVMKRLTTPELNQRITNFLRSYQAMVRLLFAGFFMLIMAHFTACMWYFTASLYDFGPDTWVMRNDMLDASRLHKYLASLYWAFTILTTVGFGDIHPVAPLEMILCIVWYVFGIGYYTYLIGTLTSILTSMDAQQEGIRAKASQMENFCKIYDVSKTLLKKMKKEVAQQATYGSMEEKRRVGILSYFSKPLQKEICFAMNNCALEKVDVLKHQDIVFITDVVPRLDYINIKATKLIYKKGDFPEAVYFIVEGHVNYVLGKENTPFKRIFKGGYFGEIELFNQSSRQFSTMTADQCWFLVMKNSLFAEIMQTYFKFAEELRNNAQTKAVKDRNAMFKLIDSLNATPSLKNLGSSASTTTIRDSRGVNFDKKNKNTIAAIKLKEQLLELRKAVELSINSLQF